MSVHEFAEYFHDFMSANRQRKDEEAHQNKLARALDKERALQNTVAHKLCSCRSKENKGDDRTLDITNLEEHGPPKKFGEGTKSAEEFDAPPPLEPMQMQSPRRNQI